MSQKQEEQKWPVRVEKALKKLPKDSGVYRFYNDENELLYVGKAKVLKNRVRSYFQKSSQHSAKTRKLIAKIDYIDWVVTRSETEALVLESNLVHELLPPYNVLLRDDKHFLYLKITKDPFPMVTFTRRLEKDGATYFGPYTSAKKIRSLIDFLREILLFRTCRVGINSRGKVTANPGRRSIPCLDYQIRRCSAPCDQKISPEEYAQDVKQLIDFMRGNESSIVARVKTEMFSAAQKKEFERAARFRDLLGAIESMGQVQIAALPRDFSADVIACAPGKEKSFFQVLIVRNGKILRTENFSLSNAESEEETLLAFLRDHISFSADIPPLLLVSSLFPKDQKEQWEGFIQEKIGKKAEIRIPERGEGRQLLELSEKNAKVQAANSRSSFERVDVLSLLQKSLDLPQLPERIECYDISHLSGEHPVGSRVVFIDGKPANSEYRHYKMRTLPPGKSDDFAAMAELLGRRLKRLERGGNILEMQEISDEKEIERIEGVLQNAGLITGIPPIKQFLFIDSVTKQEIGYARFRRRGKMGEIGGVFTLPEVRSSGLGTEIIKTVVLSLEKEKWVRVLIRSKNLKWKVSLKSVGFVEEKKPPKAFQKAIDARKKEECIDMICMKISPKALRNSMGKIPDLLVIDGGKGQLSAVVKVLRKMNLFKKIPVCSLAKKHEEIFVPGKGSPLPIPKEAPENKLLQQIRDEAHRFAISFNRHLRKNASKKSCLDEIDGIGEKTKKILLEHFGCPESIFHASDEGLLEVVSPSVVESIREFRSLDEG